MIEIAGMNLLWLSDWNGCEVGYPEVPEVPEVGLYTDSNGTYYYIDYERDIVLEEWKDEEKCLR